MDPVLHGVGDGDPLRPPPAEGYAIPTLPRPREDRDPLGLRGRAEGCRREVASLDGRHRDSPHRPTARPDGDAVPP